MMIGMDSGRATFNRTVISPAPSILADSKSSPGNPSKKAFMMIRL